MALKQPLVLPHETCWSKEGIRHAQTLRRSVCNNADIELIGYKMPKVKTQVLGKRFIAKLSKAASECWELIHGVPPDLPIVRVLITDRVIYATAPTIGFVIHPSHPGLHLDVWHSSPLLGKPIEGEITALRNTLGDKWQGFRVPASEASFAIRSKSGEPDYTLIDGVVIDARLWRIAINLGCVPGSGFMQADESKTFIRFKAPKVKGVIAGRVE